MFRILSFTCLILWMLLWFPFVALAFLFKKKKLRAALVRILCKGMLFFCGVKVRVLGEVPTHGPLLIASNHLSYLDIPILSSILDCRYVAKKEIAKWPGVNWFCKMQEVVFIDRATAKISEGTSTIEQQLERGQIVTLYPEATTGDGKHLLPFKPAFFEAAHGAPVQPVALAYRKIRGLPIDYSQWPLIAWYGDMVLLPHLWKLMSIGKIEVEVHFLPIIPTENLNRKEIAIQAHDAVEEALSLPALAKS